VYLLQVWTLGRVEMVVVGEGKRGKDEAGVGTTLCATTVLLWRMKY
jgi:hypothetical protein